MFECSEIHWEDGQELIYSPILCELCGRKMSAEAGKNIRKIAELEDEVKELMYGI
jgi:hypothetical protein